MVRGMQLTGDEAGIAALKDLAGRDKGYIKFLIGEAKSNTDLSARFKAPNGTSYNLRIEPNSGDLIVEAVIG